MNLRPDGRPTFEEAQAARRREVAARRREIEKASRDAKGLPSPTARRPLRLRLSDEPVDPVPPRKSDAAALRRSAAVRAALTDDEVALLDALQDTLRRRADLRLRPSPGALPPPLPGTPEERAALREKIAAVPAPAPKPRADREDRPVAKRAEKGPRRATSREIWEDFEDLEALPADGEVIQRPSTSDAGVAEERRLDREIEELI